MKKQNKDLDVITERVFSNLQTAHLTKEEMRRVAYRLNWKVKQLFPRSPALVPKKRSNAKKK